VRVRDGIRTRDLPDNHNRIRISARASERTFAPVASSGRDQADVTDRAFVTNPLLRSPVQRAATGPRRSLRPRHPKKTLQRSSSMASMSVSTDRAGIASA
jgi:hypothetical protein